MHELSIIQNVVEAAQEAAEREGAARVLAVHLQVGALAGVVKDALLFCYDVATRGTLLEGSSLEIEELPLVIYCPACDAKRELPGVQSFRCPVCGVASLDVRQGRELELRTIEVETQTG